MKRKKTNKTNKTEKIIKILIVLCFIIGVGFLSFPLIRNTVVAIKIGSMNESFVSEQVLSLKDLAGKDFLNENETIVPPKLKDYLLASPENIGTAVGELSIPSVGIWAPIFSGLKQEELLFGVGIYDVDRDFEKDNLVIIGHYLSISGLLLGNLTEISNGESIMIRFSEQVYEYQVIEKEIVHETEVELLEHTDEAQLTLITCDKPELTENRLVVIAQKKENNNSISGQENLEKFNFNKEKEQKDEKNRKDMLKYNLLPLIGILFLLSMCIYCILRYL